jgi:hypothetical protein
MYRGNVVMIALTSGITCMQFLVVENFTKVVRVCTVCV